MSNATKAKEFVESLLADLDRGGSNYSPDLRDSLGDHQEWLEARVRALLDEAPKDSATDGDCG